MALSLLPIHDEITEKLRELPQTVYETSVPDDNALEYDVSGLMMPHIVVNYSSLVQIRTERGITGPREDLGRSFANVMIVGPTERSVRQVMDMVVEKLTGFQPEDAGYLAPETVGRPYPVYDPSSRPIKYVTEITFSFAVNTVVS